jgi:hypothetical protein
MPPSNRSTGALTSFSTSFSSHPFVTVHRVVVDTIDSATLGLQGRFGQGANVAVLDCEGHELHALCGAMTFLMQVSAAAAASVVEQQLCDVYCCCWQGDGVQVLVTEFSPYIMRRSA